MSYSLFLFSLKINPSRDGWTSIFSTWGGFATNILFSTLHLTKIRLKELYRLSAGFNQTIASDLLYDAIIKKYEKFLDRQKILMSDKNVKFCPIPDCDGYAEKKSDKYVKCNFGHDFCNSVLLLKLKIIKGK